MQSGFPDAPHPDKPENHASSIMTPEPSEEVAYRDRSGPEAAKAAGGSEAGAVESGAGKKKSGRRPRRKKKPQVPNPEPEQVQGRQKHQSGQNLASSQQQEQQQQQQKKQNKSSPQKEQQTHSSATDGQPKATRRKVPSSAREINKSLSVAMMASPFFPLPFPLMPALGVTLLAGQGKPSAQKKGG